MLARICLNLCCAGLMLHAVAAHAEAPLEGVPVNRWTKLTPLDDTPVSPRLGYEGACVWDSWRKVMNEAGLTGGPHQLRHTFASHFLHETRDLKLLAEVMGHSHERVTELYAHLLPGHLDRARNAVNLGPETAVVTVAGRRGRPPTKQKSA